MDELFEEQKSKMQAWAFTVKKLGNGEVKPSEYVQIITNYERFGLIDCHFYEKDSLGKLHVHGIILLRPNFHRKKLVSYGFHTYLEQVYNRAGWLKYITKHEPGKNKMPEGKEYIENEFSGVRPICADCLIDTLQDLLGTNL